jgi:hypothetical protein
MGNGSAYDAHWRSADMIHSKHSTQPCGHANVHIANMVAVLFVPEAPEEKQ